MRKSVLAPEAVYPLGVDLLSVSSPHGSDASIYVAGMIPGKLPNPSRKCSIPVWTPRLIAVRRPWLPDCPAGSPLADAQDLLNVVNSGPLSGRA
jgi:hypothetical protein